MYSDLNLGIEQAHFETSYLQYNDENALSYKEYCRSLEEYGGNLLLVGINYDKKTRKHECVIEEWEKKFSAV